MGATRQTQLKIFEHTTVS